MGTAHIGVQLVWGLLADMRADTGSVLSDTRSLWAPQIKEEPFHCKYTKQVGVSKSSEAFLTAAVCIDLAMTKQKAVIKSNLWYLESLYTVYFGCALRLACSRILCCLWFPLQILQGQRKVCRICSRSWSQQDWGLEWGESLSVQLLYTTTTLGTQKPFRCEKLTS